MPQRTYLVVGSGGREHALAWRLSQDPGRPVVHVAPGSDGIDADEAIRGDCVPIARDDFEALADYVRAHAVDLTVVGPEGPLCRGLVDYFGRQDLAVFGPRKAAARLEGSKSFAKDVMTAAGVPTAAYQTFDTLQPALSHVRNATHPVVIKADGLAGGKGVIISEDLDTSLDTLDRYMADAAFGSASRRVVIEECLQGTEMSFIAVTDGHRIAPFSTSQDHKRIGEGDTGPNTGGMGAVSPSDQTCADLEADICEQIIEPTLGELRERDLSFRGFLYAGLMLTPDGPKVLEFNCRMGDPETQALLFAQLADRSSGPGHSFGEVLYRAAHGALTGDESMQSARHGYCIVLASDGYPGSRRDTGHIIEGLTEAARVNDTKIFHAGTRRDDDGTFRNAGGRVLGVASRGSTRQQARKRAYDAVSTIDWTGMQYRRDIGELR